MGLAGDDLSWQCAGVIMEMCGHHLGCSWAELCWQRSELVMC